MLTFNCLDEKTNLVIKHNEKIKFVNFTYFKNFFCNKDKEIVDVSKENLYIASKDAKFTKINFLLRKHHNDNIYKITLKNGFSFKATKDHIVEITRGKTTKETSVEELQIGDELPLTQYDSKQFSTLKEINLIDFLGDNPKITISNDMFLYHKIREKQKYNKYGKIYLKEYKEKFRGKLNLDEHDLKLRFKQSRCDIPAILPLNKQLGKFIGYLLAEGSRDNCSVCFANNDENLIQDFISCTKTLFPSAKISRYYKNGHGNTANADKITVFGRSISMLFDGILAKKTHSNDIELPQWYKYTNKEFLSGLISAEIDGDGGAEKDIRTGFLSASNKFVRQIQTLLSLHNVTSEYKQNKCKGTIAFNKNGKMSFRNFDTYSLNMTGSNFDAATNFIKDSFKINANVTTKKFNRKKRHEGKIVSIELEPYNNYVYDFTTENHFFDANGIIVHNCCQIDILKLFHGGFSTGNGWIREPQSIRSYAALACIAIQSNQNDQFGGQSIACFDYGMAEGVRKSFKKNFKKNLKASLKYTNFDNEKFINIIGDTYPTYKNSECLTELAEKLSKELNETYVKIIEFLETVYENTCEQIEDETYQAMESVIFNLNSMHSRCGSQTPFSSLNFGTDTSPEGRLVTEKLLLSQEKGLGKGETPIFPITVFKMKEGINYNPEDPNYDLFKLAIRVSAKRLFPNFVNIDAPYNLQYYKPDDPRTEIATMG